MTLKASILDRSLRVLKRFFWFCSGADTSILERAECSTEHNKYGGIGATVLLTAVLASLSGGYALFTVFRRYPQAIAFGILWGILIFNLDRYIVLSMRAERTGKKRLIWTALPRVALAILISLVVTVPLELKIFDREIMNELTTINNSKLAEEKKGIEAAYEQSIEPWEAQIRSLTGEVKEAEKKYHERFDEATLEANGKGGSGHYGMKEQYYRLQAEAEAARLLWQQKKEELAKKQAEYSNDPEVRYLQDEKLRLIKQAETTTQENIGILARLHALRNLMSKESSTFISFCLLALMFLILETAPVMTKLLSGRGPYDAFLEANEADIIAREEHRTADAKTKAETEAQHAGQIDMAFRRTELQNVEAILQSASSEPAWDAEKSEVRDEIKKRLNERFRTMFHDFLPADDSRFEHQNGREHSNSQENRPWLNRFTTAGLLLLGAVGCLILLLRFLAPDHGSLLSGDQPEAYLWLDPTKGNTYLAVRSPATFDPARLFPGRNDIRLQLADIEAPLSPSMNKAGMQTAVYTIGKRSTSRYYLSDPSAVPVVHLLGETHLGKSQLVEAALICKMIRQQEIDAVFLEQPDDLKFEWSQFSKLENDPRRAILALQYQMRSDADKVPEMRLGKYDKYFREGDLTSPDGLKAIEQRIETDYGEEGVQEFRTVANEQLRLIEDSPGGRAYAESKYISAADYLYVMTKLQNVNIPFYNVDSAALRDSFGPESGLDQREKFATQRMAEISRANGYHHVLYICGAFHLKGVVAALDAAGLQSIVEMNFLQGTLKQKLAALVNARHVAELAGREPPRGFSESSDLMLTDDPSEQMSNQLYEYLKDKDGAFDAEDISAFRSDFSNRYASEKLRSRDKWSLTLVNGTGKKTLVLSWDKRTGDMNVIYDRDPTARDLQEIVAGNQYIHKLEYEDVLHSKGINQASNDFLLAKVRKDLTRYTITFGDDIEEGKKLTAVDLVHKINKKLKQNPRKVVYLDLAGLMGDNDFEAFSYSCRTFQNQIDPTISVIAFNAVDKNNETFFSKKVRFKAIEPDIEQIHEDKYKGWFAVNIHFTEEDSGRPHWLLRILVKTRELAMELFRSLGITSRAPANELLAMSPADILAKAIQQARMRLTNEDIRAQITRELAILESIRRESWEA